MRDVPHNAEKKVISKSTFKSTKAGGKTQMVVYKVPNGKTSKGKQAFYSITRHEVIYN